MPEFTAPPWQELRQRLARSAFRSRFRLSAAERDYFLRRGAAVIRQHAFDFVRQRLAAAKPSRDGQQTPWRGHPVFVAQHATATCCRSCLAKWHGIAAGRPLDEREICYIVSVIMAWLALQLERA
ncbi:MAG: DUF4186 domain-containing protein [Planctomycetota bacterium]|nr:DUF4186 domain-containing protein [Planctomycetota bacterium]